MAWQIGNLKVGHKTPIKWVVFWDITGEIGYAIWRTHNALDWRVCGRQTAKGECLFLGD